MSAALAALVAGASWLFVASAGAANGPTFRDCSLVANTDPDFVQLSGVTVAPNGTLQVKRGQTQVMLEASESADLGDNMGHVTLNVKVASHKIATQEVSGSGTGKVILAVPLAHSKKRGRVYTISWADTTDNGNHVCPSSSTPENSTPKPFIVTVVR
jgi:hypothetical protein